jgi:acid phosphatase (class A)
VVGRDLATLPQTAALLDIVTEETEGVVVVAKDHFARLRPYGADPALPHCGKKDATARRVPIPAAMPASAMRWPGRWSA